VCLDLCTVCMIATSTHVHCTAFFCGHAIVSRALDDTRLLVNDEEVGVD
jgi:hypothetical protein